MRKLYSLILSCCMVCSLGYAIEVIPYSQIESKQQTNTNYALGNTIGSPEHNSSTGDFVKCNIAINSKFYALGCSDGSQNSTCAAYIKQNNEQRDICKRNIINQKSLSKKDACQLPDGRYTKPLQFNWIFQGGPLMDNPEFVRNPNGFIKKGNKLFYIISYHRERIDYGSNYLYIYGCKDKKIYTPLPTLNSWVNRIDTFSDKNMYIVEGGSHPFAGSNLVVGSTIINQINIKSNKVTKFYIYGDGQHNSSFLGSNLIQSASEKYITNYNFTKYLNDWNKSGLLDAYIEYRDPGIGGYHGENHTPTSPSEIKLRELSGPGSLNDIGGNEVGYYTVHMPGFDIKTTIDFTKKLIY